MLYDHHALIIFERLNQIHIPRLEGLNDKDIRITVSKTFQSLITLSKDELKLQAYGKNVRSPSHDGKHE